MNRSLWIFLFAFSFSPNLWAKKFNLDKQTFATYFKGNYGASEVGKKMFESPSSDDPTTFSDDVEYNLDGEFGLLFTTNNSVGIRLGVEVISPQKMSAISGKNAAGTEILKLDSSITGVLPSAHIDFYLESSPTQRIVLSAGSSFGTLRTNNTYTPLPAGSYTGTGHVEKGEASVVSMDISAGYEFLFVDNVSLILEAGYRKFEVNEIKAANQYIDLDGDTVAKGTVLTNEAGTKRAFDLSGAWIGLGFRFYINY